MICVYSFLFWPRSVLFKIVQSIFAGVSVGVTCVENWTSLSSIAIAPLSSDPTLLVPIMLGIMMLFSIFNRSRSGLRTLAIVSRPTTLLVLATTLAITSINGFSASFLAQIYSTANGFLAKDPVAIANAFVLAAMTIAVISYFIFSKRMAAVLKPISTIGTYIILFYLGSSFGNGAASRMTMIAGGVVYKFINFILQLLGRV